MLDLRAVDDWRAICIFWLRLPTIFTHHAVLLASYVLYSMLACPFIMQCLVQKVIASHQAAVSESGEIDSRIGFKSACRHGVCQSVWEEPYFLI